MYLEFPYKITVNSEKETEAVAHEFARILKGGELVTLNGQLGAGKTFFIKRMLASFGITNVSSPTFALVNQYKGKFNVNHFDFYRIAQSGELYDIGFDEYISDGNSVTLIEWADMFPEVLPHKRIDIRIEVNEDFSRNISILDYK